MLRLLTDRKLLDVSGAIEVEVETCDEAMANLANTAPNPADYALVALRPDLIIARFFKTIAPNFSERHPELASLLKDSIVLTAKLTHLMIAAKDKTLTEKVEYHQDYFRYSAHLLTGLEKYIDRYSFSVKFFILNKLTIWLASPYIINNTLLANSIQSVINKLMSSCEKSAWSPNDQEELPSVYQEYSRYYCMHQKNKALTPWVDDYFTKALQYFHAEKYYPNKHHILSCMEQAFLPLQHALSAEQLTKLTNLYPELATEYAECRADYQFLRIAKNFGSFIKTDLARILLRGMSIYMVNEMFNTLPSLLVNDSTIHVIEKIDIIMLACINLGYVAIDYRMSRQFAELRLPTPLNEPEWVRSKLAIQLATTHAPELVKDEPVANAYSRAEC